MSEPVNSPDDRPRYVPREIPAEDLAAMEAIFSGWADRREDDREPEPASVA